MVIYFVCPSLPLRPQSDTPIPMRSRNPGLIFIFITVLIDWMGIGLIIPVLPKLVESFLGGDLNLASEAYGYLVAAYSLMLFLFSPMMGAISDRFGRRPVLLISLFGQGLDYLLLALAPGIGWFALGRIIAGIGGGSITVAYAYVADITEPEKRAKSFGLLGAAFGLGFILGPALGGLLGELGLRAPFYVAAGLALINWFYGFLVLPESLPKDKRSPFSISKANPFGALTNITRFPAILPMISIYWIMMLAGNVMPSVWVLHNQMRFGWGESENGFSLAFVGLMVSFVQGVLTGLAVKRLGEFKAVMIGVGCMLLSLTLLGFASQGWMMYVYTLPYFLGGFATPALQALMTARVGPSDQGLLQGSLTSLMSVAAFVSPLIYTNLFSYFTSTEAPAQLPGSPFWLAALFMLVAFLLAFPVLRKLVKQPVLKHIAEDSDNTTSITHH